MLWQRAAHRGSRRGPSGRRVGTPRCFALSRLVVATTTDILLALYFYQRHGYRLTDLVVNSVTAHTKQEVPGFAGIPVRDELRLEKRIGVG
jgi:hypothetical protein